MNIMRLFVFKTLLLTLIIALAYTPDVVAQETKTVIAEGLGGARDSLRARDDAIEDALRRAVEQGVGTFVNAGTLAENYELIADKVLTNAAGYVRTYEIIEEKREEDLLRVVIRAEVALGPLRTDLIAINLLKQRLGYPRVMVMGSERADNTEVDGRTVAT